MLRIIKNIVCKTALYNFSRIHNRYSVTDICNYMCNHNNCHAKLVFKLNHKLYNLCLNCNVKRCCRLIRNQKLRLAGKRHRNHNSLSHTSGELMRILLKSLIRLVYTYQSKKLSCSLPCLFFILICMQKYNFHYLVSDSIYRVQACHRILEND